MLQKQTNVRAEALFNTDSNKMHLTHPSVYSDVALGYTETADFVSV